MGVTTTYLEMFARPGCDAPAPMTGIAIVEAHKPTVAYYRFLYDAVGSDWQWTSRKKLSDAELGRIIQDPQVELHVLFVDGVPAGFAELDGRVPGEIELKQFGLMPEFIGRGLGKFFLHWVIERAFSYNPERFWLHTCTLDHPAALPNYLKAGFVAYKTETA
ncbi:MAG TPA: GNAT family N-acetyltransferase [Planctomycetaceae bacterium]|nr:GNAT family N-acetyltransferase [Planctomycetaceae bacterium]